MEYKNGDIFRWRYTSKHFKSMSDHTSPYWCKSCICYFENDVFVDTYWEHAQEGISAYSFKYGLHKNHIILEYIANMYDLKEGNEWSKLYYHPANVINISHVNSSRGNIYIRKDAKRDINIIRESILINKQTFLHDIESAKHSLERIEKEISEIDNQDIDSIIVDLVK